MVDPARLASLLERIAAELEELGELRQLPGLTHDKVALPAAKYRLIVAIEAAVDACEHVIASEGLRASESFADAFRVLAESDFLDDELAARLADAARFRNLLVHGYAIVDDERVVEILASRLRDLAEFRRQLATACLPER